MGFELPGRIVDEFKVRGHRLGRVQTGETLRPVFLDLVAETKIGDFVTVRAGFALERVAIEAAVRAYEERGQPLPAEPVLGGTERRTIVIPQEFMEMARAYRLLASMEPGILRSLLPLASERRYPAGEVIFHEGDKSAYLHLIVSGTVALEMVTGEGSLVVQTLHAGDAMGWSALTAESRTHFQAIALTGVSTIAFRGDELRDACEREPAMGYALMKGLLELVTERLDAARMKLVNFREPGITAKGMAAKTS